MSRLLHLGGRNMVARIAIEGLVYSIDKPYSYLVPAQRAFW